MGLRSKIKHHFFNAFREIFIYHHSSLEFRASMFALVIAANEDSGECEYELVMKAGMEIYNDEIRANTLTLTTKEYVQKVRDDNGLDIDTLVHKIISELKVIPRYYKKINVSKLEVLLDCHDDEVTRIYQERMLEFLEQAKKDYEK